MSPGKQLLYIFAGLLGWLLTFSSGIFITRLMVGLPTLSETEGYIIMFFGIMLMSIVSSKAATSKGNEMIRHKIFELINNERASQDEKWGEMPRHLPDMVWLSILMEEVGECAEAVLKRDWDNLKVELIQTASVIIAWLEDESNHNNGTYKSG